MNDRSDPSGNEFSVRDQFAGTAPARTRPAPPSAPSAPSAAPPGRTGPTPPPGMPLRRPVSPENLGQWIDWTQLAKGVQRRVWVIVLLTAVGLLLGLAGRARLGKPQYAARASLLYRADRQKQMLSSSGSAVTIKSLSRVTAVSLLRRGSNLKAAEARLRLGMTPDELGWRVRTKSERQSDIVLLYVEYMPGPEQAVAAVNEVAAVGVEDNRAFYRNQAVQLAEQFKRQAAAAASEADAARDALTSYQTEHQLLEIGADTKAFLDSMVAVRERLYAARVARDAQAIRIASYRRLLQEMPDEVVRESFEDDPLKRRIANTEVALMEARTRYGPENPRVLQIEDSIREMRRTMGEPSYSANREKVYVPNPSKQVFTNELLRLEAEQAVLDRTVEQVEAQEADGKAKYAYLPRQQLELAAFHERLLAAVSLQRSLERSAAESLAATHLDLGDFEVLEPARAATVSRAKLASLLPVLALVLCLLAGTGLSVALALMDPQLKSAAQVERLYTLPCLGVVPAAQADSIAAAFLPACRAVYERLSGLPGPEGARAVCVLSARAGDGKSSLAFHLARYWAALGIRTAYLDLDPEPNPWLARPEARAGVEDYLAGRAVWDDIVFLHDGVACFKRVRDTGDLPEHMHGKTMRLLMETLRSQYACVVVEAPAWAADESSARAVAGMVDQSVWIAASPRSTRPVVNEAFAGLDRAGIRPCGMVLNQVPPGNGSRHRRGPTS